MGIDDGGDGVGGVLEAVHELEPERDQQGDAEEQKRHPGGDRGAGLLYVLMQAIGAKSHATGEKAQEDEDRDPVVSIVEIGPDDEGFGGDDVNHGGVPQRFSAAITTERC
jgi:hypothetical protein